MTDNKTATAATDQSIALPSVRPTLGYEAVADVIRREFSLGRLLPGQKLPAERVLADQIGVARETVRQALRILEGEGHLRTTRGAKGGAVILDPHTDRQLRLRQIQEQLPHLEELLEFREVVESACASLAATRRTREDLAKLTQAQREILESSNKNEFRRADTAFHLALAGAARNDRLLSAVEDARAAMFLPIDMLLDTTLVQSSYKEHQAILEAVRLRRSSAAANSAVKHLRATRDDVRRLARGLPLNARTHRR